MSEQLKKWLLCAAVILLLIPASLAAISLHGFIFCHAIDPFDIQALEQRYPEYTGSTILDHVQVEDSALVLLEKPGGQVLLLEFQKNLFLSRYQLQEVNWIGQEDSQYVTVAQTPHAVYPFQVENHANIVLIGTLDLSLQWGPLQATYGLLAYLIYCMMLLGFIGIFSYKARRKQQNAEGA